MDKHSHQNGNGHSSHSTGNGNGHDKDCVPCFTSGSYVLTKKGKILVDNVSPGMLLLTRDNGYKEVAWAGSAIGNKHVDLGNTTVSLNHRMLISNKGETLIAAKRLGRIVEQVTKFVHFMFDQHEIVNVDDVWSESFNPGPWILSNMDQDQAREIKKLFPEVNFVLAREEIRGCDVIGNHISLRS